MVKKINFAQKMFQISFNFGALEIMDSRWSHSQHFSPSEQHHLIIIKYRDLFLSQFSINFCSEMISVGGSEILDTKTQWNNLKT